MCKWYQGTDSNNDNTVICAGLTGDIYHHFLSSSVTNVSGNVTKNTNAHIHEHSDSTPAKHICTRWDTVPEGHMPEDFR